jgi:general secretion pathway protein G
MDLGHESIPTHLRPRTIPGKPLVLTIAALATLVVFIALPPVFSGRTDVDGKRMGTKATLSNLKSQLANFEIEFGRFPTTAEGLEALVDTPPGLPQWNHPFMDKLPLDEWGRPFIYRCPGIGGPLYNLCSAGPDGIEGSADDVNIDQ